MPRTSSRRRQEAAGADGAGTRSQDRVCHFEVGSCRSRVICGIPFEETVVAFQVNRHGVNRPVMEYVCMCGFVCGSTGSCHRHVKDPWRDGAPHPLSQAGRSYKPLL